MLASTRRAVERMAWGRVEVRRCQEWIWVGDFTQNGFVMVFHGERVDSREKKESTGNFEMVSFVKVF